MAGNSLLRCHMCRMAFNEQITVNIVRCEWAMRCDPLLENGFLYIVALERCRQSTVGLV